MTLIGFDLDGTLVNYGDGDIVVNKGLIDQFLKPGDKVAVITNQGGVPLGYRTAEKVIVKLAAAKRSLDERGVEIAMVMVSTYHPKATRLAMDAAATDVFVAGKKIGLPMRVWSEDFTRKPEPGMFKLLTAFVHEQLDCYIGDSDEDEAAAEAAGVSFVRVPRFMGGGG